MKFDHNVSGGRGMNRKGRGMAKRNAAKYSFPEAFDHLATEYDPWYRTSLGAFCDSL